MAKFHGVIGFGETQEVADGVWAEAITTRLYFGDVVRNTVKIQEGQFLNNDLSVQNSISILADNYANEHLFAIRFVQWAGAYWDVTSVEQLSPRLLLRLGGVYSGPTS
jgi:hypothetical protein